MRDVHKLKEKYELSLDTRQILTLTFVGLIGLGGVFVLGVAVGKKLQADEKVSQPIDLLSQLDAKSQPQLTYQTELTKDAPKPPKPVEPAPAPKPEPKAEARPEPRPELVEAPRAVDPAPPKEEPVPTRTATPERDAGDLREAIARAQRPVEATADGSWTLQLSAYQDKAEADRFASDLRNRGYAPYVVESHVAGKGTWYRVRMGRFPSREAAGRYNSDFQRETKIEAFVTHN
ncbi:MAG: SPOR domain-containing protein [Archangiaceae bacterium]|nr:SPOR domain-containing protein [Archangiaceae bacterium]